MTKGTVIPLDIPEYLLSGRYLIKHASHTIDNQDENVILTIEKTNLFEN